ncbi:hypothetical protein [Paracidobacterium acidisoli]|uniref:DUF4386 domain-containing protein n=1 Tax=Paracidobacterium acidisoli TaxID=2303751 RepID=A0A372IPN3_9BACT|nr:hypothetical protein [Paracidobacterium acidisoli]MBT9331229.1 hypothetical protein [Paracidobacterium acidisoli]
MILPAVIYTLLMFGGGATLSAAFGIPHDSVQKAAAYMAKVSLQIRWGSFCELASAIPLGVFVATAVSRLRFLRVRAAGEVIALCGGVIATGMLLISSLSIWSLTRPGIAEADGAVRALQAMSFAGGGPGFTAPLGLFIAGISIPAGLYRLIPRWLMWLGIVVAVACELSTLTLLVWNFSWFIPVGRFVSVVWMIGVAVTLPSRRDASPKAAQPAI